MQSGALTAHAIRLQPGDDLVSSLHNAARQASSACCILTAVGSLDQVTLRMASAADGSQNDIKTWNERLEVVSLVGTLSGDDKHLHLCCSDAQGRTFGGHLMAGRIFTTLELVLGSLEGVTFRRILDARTGYRELSVEKRDE